MPTARAARLTMDREGIRRLAAEKLRLRTSPYRFADTEREYRARRARARHAVRREAGDELVRQRPERRAHAGRHRLTRGRTRSRADAPGGGRIIVEGFIRFDYEITLLTVRHGGKRASAIRSATCRSTATIASPGNRSR